MNRVSYLWHLQYQFGSAIVVPDSTGAVVGENRYYPYGETRLTTGTIYTDKLFTGISLSVRLTTIALLALIKFSGVWRSLIDSIALIASCILLSSRRRD
jgi:hypothetical protein